MALLCKAVGEKVPPENLPVIEAVTLFCERSQNMQVRKKTLTELMLDATDERRGWDQMVSTTMGQPIFLTAARDKDCIRNTTTAQSRETRPAMHIAMEYSPLKTRTAA